MELEVMLSRLYRKKIRENNSSFQIFLQIDLTNFFLFKKNFVNSHSTEVLISRFTAKNL